MPEHPPSRVYAFVLRVLQIFFNLGLIYLIMVSCQKIHAYATQTKTPKIHTPTNPRDSLFAGKSLPAKRTKQ